MKPIIASAFPGTGKTHYCNIDISQYDYSKHGWAIDSDSSMFPKDHFPENYIKHIQAELNKDHHVIFVSSHKIVRNALCAAGIDFTLIYPDISLKDEYLNRYAQRGSNEDFINLISNNWDNWIRELQEQSNCSHIVLYEGQYISNVI